MNLDRIERNRVLFLILLILIGWGCYHTNYSELKHEDGLLFEKQYNAAHTDTWLMPVSCGKDCTMMVPVSEYYPDRWYLYFQCQHGRFKTQVQQSLYDKLPNNSKVRIAYFDILHEYKDHTNHSGYKFVDAELQSNL